MTTITRALPRRAGVPPGAGNGGGGLLERGRLSPGLVLVGRDADGEAEPHTPDGCTLVLTPPERRFLNRMLDVLTEREREVLYEICSGGTNDGMADRLCIALPTLRTHLMRLNQKLGTASKGDVVRMVACRLLEGYRTGQIQV